MSIFGDDDDDDSYRSSFRSSEREVYWSMPRVAILLLCTLAFCAILGFAGNAVGFWSYKFWAPKQENVRRQVFESTQSYVEGKVTYLNRLRMQYKEAEDGSVHKNVLRQTILTEASTIERDKLPEDLQLFISSLQR